MEKALTFNQLAPYLPFGIRGVSKDENLGIELVKGYSTYGMNNNINLTTNIDDIDIECFMPILRPLSDLTNEIEHNGEKFIPIYRLAELFLYNDIHNHSLRKFEVRDNYILVTFGSQDGVNSTITSVQIKTALFRMEYWQLEKLFEWNFDVFGLIPENLAIDINTL